LFSQGIKNRKMIEFAAVSKNKENLRNGNNIKPCLSATKRLLTGMNTGIAA